MYRRCQFRQFWWHTDYRSEFLIMQPWLLLLCLTIPKTKKEDAFQPYVLLMSIWANVVLKYAIIVNTLRQWILIYPPSMYLFPCLYWRFKKCFPVVYDLSMLCKCPSGQFWLHYAIGMHKSWQYILK